jgi:hypothetical protein
MGCEWCDRHEPHCFKVQQPSTRTWGHEMSVVWGIWVTCSSYGAVSFNQDLSARTWVVWQTWALCSPMRQFLTRTWVHGMWVLLRIWAACSIVCGSLQPGPEPHVPWCSIFQPGPKCMGCQSCDRHELYVRQCSNFRPGPECMGFRGRFMRCALSLTLCM